jgi:three-Cys-motif partner protein
MADENLYSGREQTKAKHFILKTYLQALAFKVLNFSDVTYVDGFSGPWETRTDNFADSSFMIAIEVLKDAQRQLANRGIRRRVRCFFCERDADAFEKLQTAVAPYHKPAEGFEVQTYFGNFTDAISRIRAFVGNSFALIFIDPTGWTGYGFDIIKPLLTPRLTEVIINYMYDFINRGVGMSDPITVASFDPILGGPGWGNRLDPDLVAQDRGMAAEKLFRETLKIAGGFEFVVSTKVYRPTIDRPHFFLTYGTKDKKGLSTFRETEYKALKQQAADRSAAKERKREETSGSADMFAGMDAAVQSERIDEFIAAEMALASEFILTMLSNGEKSFADVWIAVLQQFVLRETNVKDICGTLSRNGKIENTWRGNSRKPRDTDAIKLGSQL